MALATGADAVRADVTPVHGDPSLPLQPYRALDLDRFAGVWVGIARFPNRHQHRCAAFRAEYTPRSDGSYDLRGSCPDTTRGGRLLTRDAVAVPSGPAEMSVGLNAWLPVFRRSIVVLDVSQDYSVVVIGEPRRKWGWIMARTPEIDDARFALARRVLARNGYFVEMLERPEPGTALAHR